MRLSVLALAGIALAGSGCSTVLSTMQPAQTTPGRHVRGAMAIGVNAPVGQLADTIGAAEDIGEEAATRGSIPPERVNDFLEGVVGLLLNPPAVSGEVQGRYGFSDIVDVGLRVATGGNIRGDLRYRVIDPERPDGFYGSTGIGITYAAASIPFPSELSDFVELESISRLEFDMAMLFGWSNEIWHFWFGPKLVLSQVTTGMTFRDEGPMDPMPDQIDVNGTNFYYVGQVGAAIGYKHVWVALELTIGGIAGGAEIERNGEALFAPGYSGLMLYPALGLLVQL